MAHLAPNRYDKILTDRETIVDLPEWEYEDLKVDHHIIEPNKRMEMLGGMGFVRYEKEIIIRRLFHKKTLWMSDSPSELRDMENLASTLYGDVLIAGLGMGILTTLAHQNEKVTSITVVEILPELVYFIRDYIPMSKIILTPMDYREFVLTLGPGEFDTAALDIWANISLDDLPDMLGLWEDTRKITKVQGGGVWGIDMLINEITDMCRGYEYPDDTASELYDYELPSIADYIQNNYSDEDGDEDGWDSDSAIWYAFKDVYNLHF